MQALTTEYKNVLEFFKTSAARQKNYSFEVVPYCKLDQQVPLNPQSAEFREKLVKQAGVIACRPQDRLKTVCVNGDVKSVTVAANR